MIRKITYKLKRIYSSMGKYSRLYRDLKDYTMIPLDLYIQNLKLVGSVSLPAGAVVECGVWRGGMIAGIAKLLGNNRTYYLFDSFEGLPQARSIDGEAAIKWQQNKTHPGYYNNCAAEEIYADTLMKKYAGNYHLVKGFFSETLPGFKAAIALLRLDGDWYESTYDCFKYLYPQVQEGGLVIIDDYFSWDGCCKAVHDYLSSIKSSSRIRTQGDLCYIIKNETGRIYTA